MSAQVDVLAVIDELRSGWYGETSRLRMPPEIRGAWMRLDIARANVAALIAERDALRVAMLDLRDRVLPAANRFHKIGPGYVEEALHIARTTLTTGESA